MNTRAVRRFLMLGALSTMAIVALSAPATLLGKVKGKDKDDDDDAPAIVQLATGQFVTPTILSDAVQQFLNPGLPAYPNFVSKGDSGSFLVGAGEQASAVGLIFAGVSPEQQSTANTDGNQVQIVEGCGVANPISEVLDRLKIELLVP